MGKTDAISDLASRIEALRIEYIGHLPAKRQAITACWGRLNRVPPDSGAANELLKTLHQLKGTAGTYGLAELSHSAEAVESFLAAALADPDQDGSWDRQRIAADRLLNRLLEELGRNCG